MPATSQVALALSLEFVPILGAAVPIRVVVVFCLDLAVPYADLVEKASFDVAAASSTAAKLR